MKRALAFLLCLITVVLPLASCGGVVMTDEDKGDIFYAYITDDIYAFDPGKDYTDESATKILGMIYEGLYRLDEKGNPVKALADKVEIIEDEEKNEYKMQISIKKTKWSDGNSLTADDFVFAWKRIMECTSQSTAAALLYDVKNARTVKAGDASIDALGVVALDTYLLEITFEGKIDYDNFTKNLASLALVPLRETAVANNSRYWSRRHATLVSNGPFVIKEIDRDTDLELDDGSVLEGVTTMRIERNNYYYRNTEEDYLDKYVFPFRIMVVFLKEEDKPSNQRTYPNDLDAIFAGYESGDLLYMGDIPLAKRAELQKKAHVTDANSTYSYLFNTNNKLFSDARVRRALSMALDREAIADIVVYADAATGLIANTVYNATKGKSFRDVQGDVLKTTGDIEGAKALLKEAGVSKGSFAIKYRMNEVETAVAEYAAGVWEELGFKVDLKPLTSTRETNIENSEEVHYYIDSVQQAYETGEFDVIALDIGMYSTDAFPALAVYATELSGNGIDMKSENYDFIPHICGFSNEGYDEIIDRALAEKNIKKRADILGEAERYLLNEMPVMPLVFNKDYYLVSKELKGLETSYLGYRIFTKVEYPGYVFVPAEK
ncbi:MAG: peptide ABC transporter substrate-binding protein [Clostridia bacterium]|nr:peptide ABC transporter substrate-binding protein [Clostridia bacterium]